MQLLTATLYRCTQFMRTYIIIPIIAVILLSCIDDGRSGKMAAVKVANAIAAADTAETFDAFNNRFHKDSAFQLSRIVFPIGGRYADGENSHEWTSINWELLKEPVKELVDTTEYKHSLHKTNTSVIEKYWIENSGFKIERHFEKIGGKWVLTYYDDLEI